MCRNGRQTLKGKLRRDRRAPLTHLLSCRQQELTIRSPTKHEARGSNVMLMQRTCRLTACLLGAKLPTKFIPPYIRVDPTLLESCRHLTRSERSHLLHTWRAPTAAAAAATIRLDKQSESVASSLRKVVSFSGMGATVSCHFFIWHLRKN